MDADKTCGWKNRQTWAMALWIGLDSATADTVRGLYRGGVRSWSRMAEELALLGFVEFEGVSIFDKRIDRREITAMLREMGR